MKFLKEHYSDLLIAFQEYGMTKEDFHFVKKKGRIISQHRYSERTFSYILKKTSSLNIDNGQFEDASFYEIKMNKTPTQNVNEWVDVLSNYKSWLSELSQ